MAIPSNTRVLALLLDEATEQLLAETIHTVRDMLGRDRTFRPHLSLFATDESDMPALIRRVTQTVRDRQAPEIRLSHVGLFPLVGVVFLGATPSQPLLALHQDLFVAAAPGPKAPWIDLYRPGRWVPHCTLGEGVSDDCLQAVLLRLRKALPLPHSATAKRLEIIDLAGPAAAIVSSIPLNTTP